MEIPTSDLRINYGVKRIERNVDRLDTCIDQRFRHCPGRRNFACEQSPVRRKTDACDPGDLRNLPNEIDYATTGQRFTTSDPHLRNTELGRNANKPQGFFVRQDFM